ncbi:MAG TPA: hypothetical protein PKW75_07900, partial [candidate division Zixibacteria bacterium]|nr:hypothetical protein [candidate division Zixibacteria bacterium]
MDRVRLDEHDDPGDGRLLVREEAREAGIEQFVFITGRGKHVIADHFDHAYELESLLTAREKTAELNSLLES